jgi:hypothetical protein
MDNEDEKFVLLLQLMLAEQQGDEFEDELLACVGCYGLEEARQLSVLRHSFKQRLYLTRADLLPDPRTLPGRHFIIAVSQTFASHSTSAV